MKKCWKCAEQIQDEAIACRYCGADQSGRADARPAQKSLGCGSVFLIIVLALVFFYYLLPDSPSLPAKPRQFATAAEVARSFRTNEIAAKNRFEDAPIDISGKVYSVEAGRSSPIVMLDDEAAGVIALKFTPESNGPAAGWRAGDTLSASCEKLMYVLGVITPQGCSEITKTSKN